MSGRERKRRFFTPALAAAAAVILLICADAGFLLHSRQGRCVAVVSVRGEVVRRIDLQTAEDERFSPADGVVIAVKNHTIAFVQSPCREKRCVQAGPLSQPGQTALCMPTGVLIVLQGAGPDQPDAVL